jgi:GntR family transcriptional regulator
VSDHIHRSQPVAEQVLTLLRQRIQQGNYGPDGRLPTETELAAELRVSRATIRSAMSALAAQKLIVRRQGAGTYINRRFWETSTHFGSITEYTSMIRASGHKPSIKALDQYSRPAAQVEVDGLEIPVGSRVIVLVRLFLSDNQPAIFSIDTVPEALQRQPLTAADIEQPLPIFFKRVCGQEFTFGVSTLSAQAAPADVAEKFVVSPGAPVLCMREVFFNDHDQPLVSAINYFNEAVFQLRVARSFD